ncbi:MAG: hisH [Cohnella sp.]|nr:hisH [Cohnella sp.]
MIAIIDYGMGNLHSVSTAIEKLGWKAKVTSDPVEISAADGAILPGVGAFGDAMAFLNETGLDAVVKEYAASGKPLLGICLGMQLLFSESEEHGRHDGLGLLPGRVVRFQGQYKVPHMGWNELIFLQESLLFQGLEPGHVYFVHSFHVLPDRREDLLAVTDYHQPVTAIVGRGSLFGMQFHPEKSGELGIELLKRFLELAEHKADGVSDSRAPNTFQ